MKIDWPGLVDVTGKEVGIMSVITSVGILRLVGITYYSRPSVARTLMARLLQLFRTRSCVPWKKTRSCRLRIMSGDFLFLY